MFPSDALTRHVMRTLASLPSHFAQLTYLASLRDPYTGRYLHEGWITIASAEEVNWTIRQIHSASFDRVMELKLELLCQQLREHFESLGGSVREMAEIWLELEPYREMRPRGCSPLEYRLFISQMQAALGVLVRSPDLALLAAPSASPPRQSAPLPQPPGGN